MSFTDDLLKEARGTVDNLVEKYLDRIIFSHAYNYLVTVPKEVYHIDPKTGIARQMD